MNCGHRLSMAQTLWPVEVTSATGTSCGNLQRLFKEIAEWNEKQSSRVEAQGGESACAGSSRRRLLIFSFPPATNATSSRTGVR
jgi:hypothetical protein